MRRLNDESLVLLGWGARQRRISTAETDRTGAIAEAIAQDKELTRGLLRQVGVPVPAGRPVSAPRMRGRRPRRSAARSWSNRAMATTAAA